jgi:chaperonin cofactor prefoldin
MTVLSWAEKEKMVIELYKQGVSPKEIAHRLHMSLRDVYKIIKREFGEKKTELTNELKALILYRMGKKPVEVAIKLRIPSEESMQYYIQYKDLINLGNFRIAYKMVKEKLKEILIICEAMQRKEVTIGDIIRGFHFADELPEMESMHSAFTRTINGLREELDFVISEKQQANNQLQEVNSFIQQAQARLSSIITQRQNAEAELARINQSFNYQSQNNNANYTNNNPYYNTGYNYGNVRYW